VTERADLLVEIGTEELPPRALADLEKAFARELVARLAVHELGHGEARSFATPRRLAVRIRALQTMQPPRGVEKRGPPADRAFDAGGRPTRAADGFARSCGVAVEELETRDTAQGRYLFHRYTRPGRPASALLPQLIDQALGALPVPRRMRWGRGDAEFVRPVRWVVLLLGDEVVPARFFGQASDRFSRGHRFHHPDPIRLDRPDRYEALLRDPGHVVADREERRAIVEEQVRRAAAGVGARPRIEAELLDEVTALVEWPCPVVGNFDERFLALPPEVLIATMEGHQRYFPLWHGERLAPAFVAISNLASRDPEEVRRGNERVVRPRLADAEFFWRQDLARSPEQMAEGLASVVFQEHLGSLADKSARVAELARFVAGRAGADARQAERAARLAKADLLSEMVGEFPELQGIMGGYYARMAGEAEPVVAAIRQQYQPAYATDVIPEGGVAQTLALADRLDTLAGIFSVGQRPSGDKDPFALRRSALGVMRILTEAELALSLPELLVEACRLQPMESDAGLPDELYDFMFERLRAHAQEQGIRADVFDAVLARRPVSPPDFQRRLRAVEAFLELPEAEALAAANKRIGNILRKADPEDLDNAVDRGALETPEERALDRALEVRRERLSRLVGSGDYTGALATLAELREAVDEFFDRVMVMTGDAQLRRNRLALLQSIQARFLEIADISRLQPGVAA